jgi:hypothetical protein
MTLADIISAVVDLVTGLGLLPFIAAAAVVAVAASLYRRARRWWGDWGGGRSSSPSPRSGADPDPVRRCAMAPGDVLALVFSVLNSLGLMTIIQVVAVVLAAVAVARYFLSRS